VPSVGIFGTSPRLRALRIYLDRHELLLAMEPDGGGRDGERRPPLYNAEDYVSGLKR